MILDFDKHSLLIDNKRILIRSAAFHYFRSPGMEVWKDRLSKLKACGYNTVDIYFCWDYHSSRPGQYDFTGIRDIRALLDLTVDLGLYVIARPGPFINAELSAGGLPKWLFNVPDVIIRNKKDGDFVYSESYMHAAKEWYSRIIPIINEYHNIIAFQVENEYSTNQAEPDYIQELYDIARAMGVKVPIFHNDAFSACLYSDIVNIYALDIYPTIAFNYNWRNNPYTFDLLDNLEETIRDCSPDSPMFIAELQSGWFDKWDGYGYETIRKHLGREHINIVTKTALSQGVTMFNHFMGCGGTSWDNLGCDEVYTSYDFAAPVSEYGIPQENYYKAKEINYFLQSFNLSSTDLIASEGEILTEQCENIFAKLRQDSLNNCKWLFIRNLNKEANDISLTNGFNLTLKAYDMKILPVDLNLYGCKLKFSNLSILGRIQDNSNEAIFLLLDKNAEITVSEFEKPEFSEKITAEKLNNIIKIHPSSDEDLLECMFSRNGKTTRFIFIKEETADKTWLFKDNAVIGPDFLMDEPFKAAFNKENENKEIKIIDLKNNATKVKNIESSTNQEIPELPEKLNWNFFTCSPEIDMNYDYSSWNFVKSGEELDCISNRVYDEFIWYKGSIEGTIDQIEIDAKHCYSIYINGYQVFHHDFLHYDCGQELEEVITVNIKNKKVFQDRKNSEITVLVQNMGFNKGFENPPDLPRGILSFKTEPFKEIEWQIRGGLTPDREEWSFIPAEDLENASLNSYLIWAYSNFKFKKDANSFLPLYLEFNSPPFNTANIYLNGNLIGQYRKTREAQTKFYLMDGFLEDENQVSLVIWNKDNQQKIEDYKFSAICVNIKIGYINQFNLIDLKKLG